MSHIYRERFTECLSPLCFQPCVDVLPHHSHTSRTYSPRLSTHTSLWQWYAFTCEGAAAAQGREEKEVQCGLQVNSPRPHAGLDEGRFWHLVGWGQNSEFRVWRVFLVRWNIWVSVSLDVWVIYFCDAQQGKNLTGWKFSQIFHGFHAGSGSEITSWPCETHWYNTSHISATTLR